MQGSFKSYLWQQRDPAAVVSIGVGMVWLAAVLGPIVPMAGT